MEIHIKQSLCLFHVQSVAGARYMRQRTYLTRYMDFHGFIVKYWTLVRFSADFPPNGRGIRYLYIYLLQFLVPGQTHTYREMAITQWEGSQVN